MRAPCSAGDLPGLCASPLEVLYTRYIGPIYPRAIGLSYGGVWAFPAVWGRTGRFGDTAPRSTVIQTDPPFDAGASLGRLAPHDGEAASLKVAGNVEALDDSWVTRCRVPP